MASKRFTKYRNYKNSNYRKRRAHLRKRSKIQAWIQSTIEGKLIKHASLSPLIFTKKETTVNKRCETQCLSVKVPQCSQIPSFSDQLTDGKIKVNNARQQQQQQEHSLKQNEKTETENVKTPSQAKGNNNKKNVNNQATRRKPKSDDKHSLETATTSKSGDSPKPITEQLIIDVPDNKNNNFETTLTKCSVDSGIEDSRRSTSSSPLSINETNDKPNGTNFAQNVLEFVNRVQEKIKLQQATSTQVELSKADLEYAKPLPARPPARKRERVNKLLSRDIEYCVYMMEKYGNDFEAMSNDEQNIYMDDVKSIARKLRVFRESPHYNEYLDGKTQKIA